MAASVSTLMPKRGAQAAHLMIMANASPGIKHHSGSTNDGPRTRAWIKNTSCSMQKWTATLHPRRSAPEV